MRAGLDIMQTVLIVIHLMIVLALVGVVLIQRSEGGGLGIGGGSGFMSARGTANALTRTTAILATLFFITSLSMGVLARYSEKPTDILDQIPAGQTTQGNGILDAIGGAPAKPVEPTDNGVPTNKATTPAAPAANAPAAPAASAAPAAATTPAPAATTTPATPAAPAAGEVPKTN
jgi:preprotein translocase subunit SecG